MSPPATPRESDVSIRESTTQAYNNSRWGWFVRQTEKVLTALIPTADTLLDYVSSQLTDLNKEHLPKSFHTRLLKDLHILSYVKIITSLILLVADFIRLRKSWKDLYAIFQNGWDQKTQEDRAKKNKYWEFLKFFFDKKNGGISAFFKFLFSLLLLALVIVCICKLSVLISFAVICASCVICLGRSIVEFIELNREIRAKKEALAKLEKGSEQYEKLEQELKDLKSQRWQVGWQIASDTLCLGASVYCLVVVAAAALVFNPVIGFWLFAAIILLNVAKLFFFDFCPFAFKHGKRFVNFCKVKYKEYQENKLEQSPAPEPKDGVQQLEQRMSSETVTGLPANILTEIKVIYARTDIGCVKKLECIDELVRNHHSQLAESTVPQVRAGLAVVAGNEANSSEGPKDYLRAPASLNSAGDLAAAYANGVGDGVRSTVTPTQDGEMSPRTRRYSDSDLLPTYVMTHEAVSQSMG